jgi:hypothetical protein
MWEEAGIFLLSALKFLFAPAAAVALGYGFMKTFLLTSSGGISGILFFYYFGRIILSFWRKLFWRRNQLTEAKPDFKKRVIVDFKNRYGLAGIAIASPILISIPVGAFVASRFFRKKTTLLYMFFSVYLWSWLLTAACFYFKTYFISKP